MKILELPSQNCSRIYNEKNFEKFLPDKLPKQEVKYQETNAQAHFPMKEPSEVTPSQGFQGQHVKERKISHPFKSHSPQPGFYSDQSHPHIKNNNSASNIQHTHSSENLAEKEFASVNANMNAGTTNQKTSVFKVPSQPGNILQKKASLNLFEEEEKMPSGEKNKQINNKGDENLLIFSPTINTQKKMFSGEDGFKLDGDLYQVLTREQIKNLEEEYVKGRVEIKVIKRSILFSIKCNF